MIAPRGKAKSKSAADPLLKKMRGRGQQPKAVNITCRGCGQSVQLFLAGEEVSPDAKCPNCQAVLVPAKLGQASAEDLELLGALRLRLQERGHEMDPPSKRLAEYFSRNEALQRVGFSYDSDREKAQAIVDRYPIDLQIDETPRPVVDAAETPVTKTVGIREHLREAFFRRIELVISRFNAKLPRGDGNFLRRILAVRNVANNSEFDRAQRLVETWLVDDEPKAARSEASPANQAVGTWGPSVDLQLDLCDRHPANRDPSEASILERLTSLEAEGQLEDIRVRSLGDGRYQILSGETRVLAARRLGRKTLRGQVINCDDERALELLADFNSHRTDLTAIEKAKLIVALCEAGKTREQAAKKVGLESAAAASNLVRLLELPPQWQQRVIAGEIAQSMAREILPARQIPAAIDDLDETWDRKKKGNDYDQTFDTRENLHRAVESIIDEHTRRLDAKHFYRGSKGYGEYACLIHKDDIEANRKKLGFVTISVTERGKSTDVEVATNVELFDKLQTAAVEKHLAAKQKTKAGKAAADGEDAVPKGGQKRALTPAQQKERKADLAKQLAGRRAAWRHAWLGSLVADRLPKHLDVLEIVILWLAADGLPNNEQGVCKLNEVIVEEVKARGGKPVKGAYGYQTRAGLLCNLLQMQDMKDLAATALAMVRQVLLKEERDWRSPRIRHEHLDAIARRCNIDLDAEWRKAHIRQAVEIDEFFALHNQEQLDALGEEWGVPVEKVKGKDAKVTALLGIGGVPMPACIKPLEEAPKRKKGGK